MSFQNRVQASFGEGSVDVYRAELLARLEALCPASLLDVGCGEGALIERLCARAVSCTGVEPDDALAAIARARHLDVRGGRAEDLAFGSGSFDVVVLQYTSHHVEFLDRALLEAARVARKHVFVLDGWFDLEFPSQRVGHAFDCWVKRIDRRQGLVHDPLSLPARIAQLFTACRMRIDLATRLQLGVQPIAEMYKLAEHYRAIASPADLELLEQIMDAGRLYGVSRPGAFLLCASME